MALGIRSIQEYPHGLGGGCFRQSAGLGLDAAREFNQHAFGFPGPGATFCKLPIAPLMNAAPHYQTKFSNDFLKQKMFK
jgi:hypothetical protein